MRRWFQRSSAAAVAGQRMLLQRNAAVTAVALYFIHRRPRRVDGGLRPVRVPALLRRGDVENALEMWSWIGCKIEASLGVEFGV